MIQRGRCSHWSLLQAEAAALRAGKELKRAVCCRSWLRTCWVGCIQSRGPRAAGERPERGGAVGVADGAFATKSEHCGAGRESDSVPVALVVGLSGSGQWLPCSCSQEGSPSYREGL